MLTINHQFDSILASSGILSLSGNTGALVLPNGGSAQRPASANNAGAIRYNTDSSSIELSNGTSWTNFSGGVNGPTSSTNNAIPTWNGTGGNTLQNTLVGIDSLGNVTGVNSITGTSLHFTSGTVGPVAINGTTVNVTGTVNSTYGSFSSQLLAPTLGTSDSSINVATTAFVQSVLSIYAPINSPSFTGTINSAGQAIFNVGLRATTVGTQGYGVRILSDPSTGTGIIQFTNNPTTLQTASIIVDSAGNMTLNPSVSAGAYLNYSPPSGDSSGRIATTGFVNPAHNFASPGYQKFASGLIMQWGYVTTSGGGVAHATFPVAFPSAFLAATLGLISTSPINAYTAFDNESTTGMNIYTNAAGGGTQLATVFYIALGI